MTSCALQVWCHRNCMEAHYMWSCPKAHIRKQEPGVFPWPPTRQLVSGQLFWADSLGPNWELG